MKEVEPWMAWDLLPLQDANGEADVREAVKEEQLERLLQGKSAESLHKDFCSQASADSIWHSYIAAKLHVLLKPEDKSQALQDFINSTPSRP